MIPVKDSKIYRQGSYPEYITLSELAAHLQESVAMLKYYKQYIDNYNSGTFTSETDLLNINRMFLNQYNLDVVNSMALDLIPIKNRLLNILSNTNLQANVKRSGNVYYRSKLNGSLLISPSLTSDNNGSYLTFNIKVKGANFNIYSYDTKLIDLYSDPTLRRQLFKEFQPLLKAYLEVSLSALSVGLDFRDKFTAQIEQIKESQSREDIRAIITSLETIFNDTVILKNNFDFEGLIQQEQ